MLKEVTHTVVGFCLAVTSATTALAEGLKIEVIHRWTSGGEAKAVAVFADAFEADGNIWIDTAIAENEEAAAVARTVGGDPPGAFQFNVGTDMDELAEAGLLRNLNEVAAQQGWEEKVPSFVWDAITRNGDVFAVPVNLQSEVWVWYSKKVFEAAGAALPTSYDELFVALDKIMDAGFVPLALGGQPWQEQILFDKVLVGVGGPDFYLRLYSDEYIAALQSDTFREVAGVYGRLRSYVDEGSPGRDWNIATNMIIKDVAGMQVMGDWAKGEFIAAGLTQGKEYGCLEGPGHRAMLLSGDVFVMPQTGDETTSAAQEKLAELMFSKEVQVDFNLTKGSVPVRLDVVSDGLDICARAAMNTMKDPKNALPAKYFFLSNDTRSALMDAITTYWNDPELTAADLANDMLAAFKNTM